MKTLKLTCLSVLVAVALAGCDEDPTQVSTVPAGSGPGTSVPTGSGAATLSWDAPTSTLYLTNSDTDSVVKWTDAGGLSVVGALPPASA